MPRVPLGVWNRELAPRRLQLAWLAQPSSFVAEWRLIEGELQPLPRWVSADVKKLAVSRQKAARFWQGRRNVVQWQLLGSPLWELQTRFGDVNRDAQMFADRSRRQQR